MTDSIPKGESQPRSKGKAITVQADPKPAFKALDARESRFVDEYLIDLNVERAALAAGYSASMATSKAYSWVSSSKQKPHVFAAIQARRQELQEETGITQELVLARLWNIATADPNELMTYRRVCCRYCWGNDHQYQWVDTAEWMKACAKAKDDNYTPPTQEGGMDFDKTEKPHPKCPRCKGEGVGDTLWKDTGNLSPAGKALYAGIKVTKQGHEVKTHDQLAALNSVARHLGMFNDKLTLKGDEENPLHALVMRVSGKTIGPASE
ncbi:small terminase subunit [Pseudomonas phage Skulduggery]|uniref:Small terminase subunit n=1 Tax=Pseudomonas phage Skulduggery TaxID=2006671 RepID=A0A1Y0SUQ3_9CAUD|nr:small terminase subunit [Pseudomonas phage Skulduggery]ARV77100.1 small terminase subunit [Pseudomonas phage Skulduggery]